LKQHEFLKLPQGYTDSPDTTR